MEEQKCILRDKIQAAKAKTEILGSTLLAIYVAEKENIYDATMYAEAIHGSMKQTQELTRELQEALELLTKKETL